MISILRTDSDNPDFTALVKLLDAYLAEMDGEEHAFYAKLNTVKENKIRNVVLAYDGDTAVACGAMKEFEPGTIEIKRMYTSPVCRGKGIAFRILAELERWATELGYHNCILETGIKQVEAIALYKKSGYNSIPSYGQYVNVANSVCFGKTLP